MKNLIVIGLCAALAGCAGRNLDVVGPQPDLQKPFYKPASLTPAQLKVVKQGVSNDMKDPESSRFRNIVAFRMEEGVLKVCGDVNAKNSYGGYAGYTPFMGLLAPTSNQFTLVQVAHNEATSGLVVTMCLENTKQGTPLFGID